PLSPYTTLFRSVRDARRAQAEGRPEKAGAQRAPPATPDRWHAPQHPHCAAWRLALSAAAVERTDGPVPLVPLGHHPRDVAPRRDRRAAARGAPPPGRRLARIARPWS